jgi:hypothetical protein
VVVLYLGSSQLPDRPIHQIILDELPTDGVTIALVARFEEKRAIKIKAISKHRSSIKSKKASGPDNFGMGRASNIFIGKYFH